MLSEAEFSDGSIKHNRGLITLEVNAPMARFLDKSKVMLQNLEEVFVGSYPQNRPIEALTKDCRY